MNAKLLIDGTVASMEPGDWVSGWATSNGDVVHSAQQSENRLHHADLLAHNLWILTDAGYREEEFDTVLDMVQSLDNAVMTQLANRGVFAFAIDQSGTISYDFKTKVPPAVDSKVKALSVRLFGRAKQTESIKNVKVGPGDDEDVENWELVHPHGKLEYERLNHSVWIMGIEVDPDRRKQGVATQLMTALYELPGVEYVNHGVLTDDGALMAGMIKRVAAAHRGVKTVYNG